MIAARTNSMHSMQHSYLSSIQDTARGSPSRQPSTPSKNQSLNSPMKRTQSNNTAHNKSEMFPWDSPTRVSCLYVELVIMFHAQLLAVVSLSGIVF